MFIQDQVLLNTPPHLIPHTPMDLFFSNSWKFSDKLAKYIDVASTTVYFLSPTPRKKLDPPLYWVFYSFDILEQRNQ